MTNTKCLIETLRESVKANIDSDALEKQIWKEFGQTCAVLILDSTGFSRTTQKKGIVYFLSIVVEMREIGRRIFAEHDVIGFRAEADNLFAEFSTVDQALDAAFEMHRYLNENELMLADDEPFRVCIGIGYGKLLKSRHEGMYGDEMNLASKLGEDTAEGGQTLITEQAYLALPNRENLISHRRFVTISGVELPYFEVEQR